uniref:Uncharacterized protein n=1 Tax=Hyaloperonospora arabidopsidis (strain Emoy2) TaxID=559515 RepID=M4BCZ9_HYAAE
MSNCGLDVVLLESMFDQTVHFKERNSVMSHTAELRYDLQGLTWPVLALTACPDKSVYRFAMKEGVTASLFKNVDDDFTEMGFALVPWVGTAVPNPMIAGSIPLRPTQGR